MKKYKVAVVFGGTGFIGISFANHLLKNKTVDKVYLVDIVSPKKLISRYRKSIFNLRHELIYIYSDVRKSINFDIKEKVFLIANFAAIHREPGHNEFEYFQTNLLGAENVCEFAERVKCNNIIFSSSIAPYGESTEIKDEYSIPIPDSAYGSSKLVAEKIHQIWQSRDKKNRFLTIVRPGVVFGAGEGGNVSRLIKAVIHRYFFYIGNKKIIKAGIYVKELCNALCWIFHKQRSEFINVITFNMTMNPGPTMQQYVESICKVANIRRWPLNVPYKFLLVISIVIDYIANLIGIKHPFSPTRIKKLVRCNNISPSLIVNLGYNYKYSLESALLDWKNENPEEWK